MNLVFKIAGKEVYRGEVILSTGISDKKGQLIYEGDILYANGWNISSYDKRRVAQTESPNHRQVIWNEDHARFSLILVDTQQSPSGIGLTKHNARRMTIDNSREMPHV